MLSKCVPKALDNTLTLTVLLKLEQSQPKHSPSNLWYLLDGSWFSPKLQKGALKCTISYNILGIERLLV